MYVPQMYNLINNGTLLLLLLYARKISIARYYHYFYFINLNVYANSNTAVTRRLHTLHLILIVHWMELT